MDKTKDQEMSSHIAATRLVRNWCARCPVMFENVDIQRLISHLAGVHAVGGVGGLTTETGLKRIAVIDFLRTAS